MTNGLPSKRREAIAAQLRKAEAAPVFGLGNGRIYGLILMLLLVVFVLLNFRGAAPRVLERVFRRRRRCLQSSRSNGGCA